MNYVYIVFALLAGIGVFLVGCKLLSTNMENLSTVSFRNLFFKTSKSKLIGVGIGTVSTAIVQSSSLTTVMVVGLVNAGIMSLSQATTVIIGANIGTTITGQIASLQSFNFSKIAMGLAGIGIFLNLFAKKEKTKIIGNALAGLGLVFVGLMVISDAMTLVKESDQIVNILTSLTNPFLLFLIGILVTAIIQSSSAVTSIVISMASAGLVIGSGGNSVLYVILGTNVGTCVTALLSSVGTNTNAKRASVIHLLFNVFGSVLFFIILIFWKSFMDDTFVKIFNYPTTQIAMFHTFFNVVCACLFLPFTELFVKVSKILVKDKKEIVRHSYLEKRLLNSSSVAIQAAVKETMHMLDMAMLSLNNSIISFVDKNESLCSMVIKNNNEINKLNQEITDYLINISSTRLTLEEEKFISSLHDSISDIVRISELADNIIKYTDREIKENLIFSKTVKEQVDIVRNLLNKQSEYVHKILLQKDFKVIEDCDKIEDEIDNLRKELIKGHIERLNKGECRAESSSVFINLANNLERVGDHLFYIAHSTSN